MNQRVFYISKITETIAEKCTTIIRPLKSSSFNFLIEEFPFNEWQSFNEKR